MTLLTTSAVPSSAKTVQIRSGKNAYMCVCVCVCVCVVCVCGGGVELVEALRYKTKGRG